MSECLCVQTITWTIFFFFGRNLDDQRFIVKATHYHWQVIEIIKKQNKNQTTTLYVTQKETHFD